MYITIIAPTNTNNRRLVVDLTFSALSNIHARQRPSMPIYGVLPKIRENPPSAPIWAVSRPWLYPWSRRRSRNISLLTHTTSTSEGVPDACRADLRERMEREKRKGKREKGKGKEDDPPSAQVVKPRSLRDQH